MTNTKLIHELSLFASMQNKNNFLFSYNLMRLKRFLFRTLIIFFLQYQCISSLSFSGRPLPLYFPIAYSFIFFYFLGGNAFLGLLLGSVFAYLLKGLSPIVTLLYTFADIGGGYLGAFLCKDVFSSDIKPFANRQESIIFIAINAFITCFISGMIRITPLIWKNSIPISWGKLLFQYILLWLADLNAILILSAFLLTWFCVPFSREKIAVQSIKKSHVLIFILLIGLMILGIKQHYSIYILTFITLLAIYGAYYYGSLIGTLLLFIVSNLYLAYFIIHQNQISAHLGTTFYVFVPVVVFVYAICILYAGNSRDCH